MKIVLYLLNIVFMFTFMRSDYVKINRLIMKFMPFAAMNINLLQVPLMSLLSFTKKIVIKFCYNLRKVIHRFIEYFALVIGVDTGLSLRPAGV
jgi:hypothetical protein